MQTISFVSEEAGVRVILMLLKLDIWKMTGEKLTEYSRPQSSVQCCRRIVHG